MLAPGISKRPGDGWGLITLPEFDVNSPSQKYKATKEIIEQVAKMVSNLPIRGGEVLVLQTCRELSLENLRIYTVSESNF